MKAGAFKLWVTTMGHNWILNLFTAPPYSAYASPFPTGRVVTEATCLADVVFFIRAQGVAVQVDPFVKSKGLKN